MNITKKLVGSTLSTVALFAIAAALIIGGAVGVTKAAPTYVSNNYRAEVEVPDLGTALVENGEDVGDEGLLQGITGNVKPGKKYDEVLAVRNTKNSDEYVRVTVRKYWTDKDGNKLRDRDTDLIDLEFDTTDGWTIDDGSTTDERTVLYYAHVLKADGKPSAPFTKSLTISKDLPVLVTQEREEVDGGTVITTTYTYDDVLFVVEADVDAVQTHSPVEAILSAWGVDVTLSGTDISLA